MGFLKRDDGPGKTQAAVNDSPPAAQDRGPQDAALAAAPQAGTYKAGSLAGVPESGLRRIERMKQDVSRGFFTSDLSVNEFLVIREAGFEPLGLVLGSSIYHVGLQGRTYNENMELNVLTQAMYNARDLAMTRMEEEADQLGADGIVGVRLTVAGTLEAELREFIAVGTAVKHRAGELHRAPNGRPFTSDLSGQHFSTLLRSGYRPVGLVLGNCVYHVAHQGLRAALKQIGRNQEVPTFTQAIYDARELAMQRMQTEAEELQATGIVGVDIREGSHGWGAHVIEYTAIGNAVVSVAPDRELERPALVLPIG